MFARWLVAVLLLVSCGGSADSAVVTSTVFIADGAEADPDSTSTTVGPVIDSTVATATTATAGGCADVISARAEVAGDGTYTFTATVVSDDTGWDKYADAWIIRADGEELGRRVLTHPHETEQPFTRSLSGVVVPESVLFVQISANDLLLGECGALFELAISHR